MSKFDEPLTVYTKQNWISDSKARPITKRSLVQALSWSLDVVYCVLYPLYPHYLNSPSCNWVPAYAGVNMGWTSVLSRGSQWLSSDKHHGNPLHLIGGGFNFNWTEFLSWSPTPDNGHQIGLGWFFQCIDWCIDFNFQDFKIYVVYYAAATLSLSTVSLRYWDVPQLYKHFLSQSWTQVVWVSQDNA